MNFLKDLKNSIYNPAFYHALLDRDFSYSLAYYAKLSAVIALVWATSVSLALVPIVYQLFGELNKSVAEVYPPLLELTLKNGELTKNMAGPVRLEMPEFAGSLSKVDKNDLPNPEIKTLLVIDTEATADLKSYQKAKALILVTKKAVVYTEDNDRSSIKISPFDQTMTGSLNQAKLVGYLETVRPWLKIFVPALVVIIFLVFMFIMYVLLLPLALLALLVWALLSLLKKNMGRVITYGTAYRLTLHASTLSFLVWAVLSVILGVPSGVLLFSALTLFLTYLNFRLVIKI